MLNIPIVIAAYNRKAPLERLLGSLKNAVYPDDVKLIISIDGSTDNGEIIDIAKRFKWNYGEKQIITSEHNMGLRNHILKCGRLAKEYDGIILFEDDLYVAPYFYDYVIQSHKVYGNDKNITGIALYSHQYNETACLPFKPIDDGYDIFFMQVACSWGQSWLTHQWKEFEEWYDSNYGLDLSDDKDVPPDVRLWPTSSWKKYYLKYMVENSKYFVYARISLTTNFADPGVHHQGTNIFQVPLLCRKKEYVFSKLEYSIAKYDAYCEVVPETLKKFVKELEDYDFEVDLYGMKNKREVILDYIITTQYLSCSVRSFGRNLKPHEHNICENISGDEIYFGLKKNMINYGAFLRYRTKLNQNYVNTHSYFFPITQLHYKPDSKKEKFSMYKRIYMKLRRVLLRWWLKQ